MYLMQDIIKLMLSFMEKFTSMTGIKVNLINGKSGALEKRIIEEGADSSADLYITADAGRCGAMDAKGHLQGGLSSAAIKAAVPKSFRTINGLE
jgi:iron(III) transport system substrate-binding protein